MTAFQSVKFLPGPLTEPLQEEGKHTGRIYRSERACNCEWRNATKQNITHSHFVVLAKLWLVVVCSLIIMVLTKFIFLPSCSIVTMM